MIVGYARVSTSEQSLDVQLDKLSFCERVFQEKHTGTTDKRPQLTVCLDFVREGDTLAVTRLDRLARSTLHLCQIAETLQKKQVNLKVIDQSIDTSDATGRLLFHMLGAIAQFETELRAERQREGIHKAREQGVIFGRQRLLTDDQTQTMRLEREGKTITQLMKLWGMSKASVYRYLRENNVT